MRKCVRCAAERVSSYLLGSPPGRYNPGLRFAAVSNSYEGARHYIQSISKVLIGARQLGRSGSRSEMWDRMHTATGAYVYRVYEVCRKSNETGSEETFTRRLTID